MLDYRQSGVNINEGYRAVREYKRYSEKTVIPGTLNGLGGFASMFQPPAGFSEPVLVSGTDGVGTKLEIAAALKKYDTVGIDCVAMCVNDILCHGARPLFFLDYIACGKLDADVAAALVKGVAEGCLEAGCALVGGETAEMPGFYDAGKYDLAGFAVGLAEKSKIINGRNIAEGDLLIGLASSGAHSNGFSLLRKIFQDYNEEFNGQTIGEILLKPTRIYVKPILSLLEQVSVCGMAHITGGGFFENIPRMFREDSGLYPCVKNGSWPIPSLFDEIVRKGAARESMFNTFNMGVGFVVAVHPCDAKKTIDCMASYDIDAWEIGCVKKSTNNFADGTRLMFDE